MKCVCPMGGDRTCPDDCPLAVWANLSPTDRKAQRKSVAEKLYKQGFTMEQIATQLGASHQTIGRDLANLSITDKLKPAKTTSNPKGAGRPKMTPEERAAKKSSAGPQPKRHKNGVKTEQAAATLVLDEGKSYEQAAKAVGLQGSVQVVKTAVAREEGRREILAEPPIDASTLSMTAQEKLDAAICQHQRKLDLTFEQRVRDEVRRRVDEIVLPHWKQRIEEAQRLYKHRRGAMDKDTFNKIRRGLHPDSRQSISDRVLADAFNTFMSLEKFLLDEKASPTEIGPIPDSLAEWDKMRAATTAERKAKYSSKSALRTR